MIIRRSKLVPLRGNNCAFRNQFFIGPWQPIVHDTIVRRQISATNRTVSSCVLRRCAEVCVSDSCTLIPRGFACSPFRLLNGNVFNINVLFFFSISFRNCHQAITNGNAIHFTFTKHEFLILIREILTWTEKWNRFPFNYQSKTVRWIFTVLSAGC